MHTLNFVWYYYQLIVKLICFLKTKTIKITTYCLFASTFSILACKFLLLLGGILLCRVPNLYFGIVGKSDTTMSSEYKQQAISLTFRKKTINDLTFIYATFGLRKGKFNRKCFTREFKCASSKYLLVLKNNLLCWSERKLFE